MQMISRYVVKKGGKFLSVYNSLTSEISKAELFESRQAARDAKTTGEKVYKVALKPVEFQVA
jgi:hypothetical protein